MSFIETPRFPERISYGASGGPGWRTQIAESMASFEQRNGAWIYPRHRWEISQGLNAPDAWVALRAFFLIARGRLHGWRFKDWADYTAAHSGAEAGVVSGLTATTYQMHKRYTSGGTSIDRIIRKPVDGTVEVKVSGVVDGSASVDATTGIITIGSAPAASVVTWAGEFDTPMRFDIDDLRGVIVARNGSGLVIEWAGVPIVEIKV
jgi:uncharacterized protein (TIGR02217 family)